MLCSGRSTRPLTLLGQWPLLGVGDNSRSAAVGAAGHEGFNTLNSDSSARGNEHGGSGCAGTRCLGLLYWVIQDLLRASYSNGINPPVTVFLSETYRDRSRDMGER